MTFSVKRIFLFNNYFISCLLIGFLLLCSCTSPDTEYQGDGTQEKEVADWASQTDCSTCHDKYVKSMDDTNLLVYSHAQEGLDCFDCHEVSLLEKVHSEINPEKTSFITPRKYEQKFCLKCHGSYTDLIELTKKSTAFLADDVAINPHDTHRGQEDCYRCHKIHKERSPIEYCNACHHGYLTNCNKCHENESGANKNSAH